jgi:hypothetical protein
VTPSLERTATETALGPRGGQCHHPPRGPSAPCPAAQQLVDLHDKGRREISGEASSRPEHPDVEPLAAAGADAVLGRRPQEAVTGMEQEHILHTAVQAVAKAIGQNSQGRCVPEETMQAARAALDSVPLRERHRVTVGVTSPRVSMSRMGRLPAHKSDR